MGYATTWVVREDHLPVFPWSTFRVAKMPVARAVPYRTTTLPQQARATCTTRTLPLARRLAVCGVGQTQSGRWEDSIPQRPELQRTSASYQQVVVALSGMVSG